MCAIIIDSFCCANNPFPFQLKDKAEIALNVRCSAGDL